MDGDKAVQKKRMTAWLWKTLFALVFGPFVLLFAFAPVGINMASLLGLGTWFMLALAACGLVSCVGSFIDATKAKEAWQRRENLFFGVVAGALTYLWISIALKRFL